MHSWCSIYFDISNLIRLFKLFKESSRIRNPIFDSLISSYNITRSSGVSDFIPSYHRKMSYSRQNNFFKKIQEDLQRFSCNLTIFYILAFLQQNLIRIFINFHLSVMLLESLRLGQKKYVFRVTRPCLNFLFKFRRPQFFYSRLLIKTYHFIKHKKIGPKTLV